VVQTPDILPQKRNYAILYQIDAKIDRNAVKEALSRSSIAVENQYEIVSFNPSLGKRPNSSDEWESIRKEAVQWFFDIKNKLSTFPSQPVFHIFSLAPIPLVIHFGALISSWSQVIPYQYRKNDNSWHPWIGKPDKDEFFNITSRPENQTARDLLVFISVTQSIEEQAQKLNICNKNKHNVLAFKAKTVSEETISSSAVAMKAAEEVKTNLHQTLNKLQGVRSIHLFFSGPVALGLLIGRQINPNVIPNVHLYNYFPDKKPAYRSVCQINARSVYDVGGKFKLFDNHPFRTIISIALALIILSFSFVIVRIVLSPFFGNATWITFLLITIIVLVAYKLVDKEILERFVHRYLLGKDVE
jgi:hypothetical protein